MKFLVTTAFTTFFSVLVLAQEYKLMWEDNFDKPLLNEMQHWTIEVDGNGGGNNELQYYRRENISIEQHTSGVNCLVISAKKENFGGRVATSGRLVTRGKVAAKYGKIEARIKLPSTANGLWPAFWLMGEDFPTVGWPRCGEIDVMEMGNVNGINRGTQDRYFNGACHWGENHAYFAQDFTAPYSLQDDFHLYTLIWDPVSIKMYLDLDKHPTNAPYFQMNINGTRVPGQTSYYFHKPFSILLNLAVGGNFTGITGSNNINKITALPADGTPVKMYVDFVRIYQKGSIGEEFYGPVTIDDDSIPTGFTASLGNITPNSIELHLNATDNSGSVFYHVTYGAAPVVVPGVSGILKSHIITHLNSSTEYHFSIEAKDGNGNRATNNPIVVSATTKQAEIQKTLNYETYGHDWSWTLFNNGNNAQSLYAIVNNPSIAGINTSPKCAKYTINANAAPWAGIWSDNLVPLTFTADNCIVKAMVYKNVISNFDIKFEGAGGLNFEIKVPNTLVNQWEELTFDFTNHIGSTVTRMVIIPDFPATRTAGSINHWDNISFNSKNISNLDDHRINDIRLFPNPFENQLNISSNETISHIEIRNLVGQLIAVELVQNITKIIDLNQLDSGQYFISIILNSGKTVTKRAIKI